MLGNKVCNLLVSRFITKRYDFKVKARDRILARLKLGKEVRVFLFDILK